MSAQLRINTLALNFGERYDPAQMRQLMLHVQELTKLNQQFVQLLRGGTVGQVLKKTGPADLDATWVDP